MQLFGQKPPIRGQPPKIGGNVASMQQPEGGYSANLFFTALLQISHMAGQWHWGKFQMTEAAALAEGVSTILSRNLNRYNHSATGPDIIDPVRVRFDKKVSD